MAVGAGDIEPRQGSFKGAKLVLTAFAPKIEAARPERRAALIAAMLTAMAYHRVGSRPGRWEPRARKRRPKPGARLTQPRGERLRVGALSPAVGRAGPTVVAAMTFSLQRAH
jgi:hypothetical protein